MKLIQRLEIPPEIKTEVELLCAIDNGARFVIFQYCISIIAFALVRYSPAILVLNEEELKEKALSYNRLSRIFGWWSIPYGISETLKSFSINHSGGVDVTEDILLNFNSSMFESKEVELLKTNQLFIKPNKDTISCFNRTMANLKEDSCFTEVVAGLFVNTEEYEDPYLVVGIDSSLDLNECEVVMSKALYKHFASHTNFTFIDLKVDNELSKRLRLQGIKLK